MAWAAGDPFARAVIEQAQRRLLLVVVPLVVVAQTVRGGPQDASINRVLKAAGEFAAPTLAVSREAGHLLGRTSMTDAVDAVVVAEALRLLPTMILTSDPADISKLAGAHPDHAR